MAASRGEVSETRSPSWARMSKRMMRSSSGLGQHNTQVTGGGGGIEGWRVRQAARNSPARAGRGAGQKDPNAKAISGTSGCNCRTQSTRRRNRQPPGKTTMETKATKNQTRKKQRRGNAPLTMLGNVSNPPAPTGKSNHGHPVVPLHTHGETQATAVVSAPPGHETGEQQQDSQQSVAATYRCRRPRSLSIAATTTTSACPVSRSDRKGRKKEGGGK